MELTMTTFDKREQGFEAKFAHDEELIFKATARSNKLLGLWPPASSGSARCRQELFHGAGDGPSGEPDDGRGPGQGVRRSRRQGGGARAGRREVPGMPASGHSTTRSQRVSAAQLGAHSSMWTISMGSPPRL
uniref:Uncharacterized protein n=1 Tax=Bradyrhizobium japonicum TaxID=375 RepID=Q9L8L3_BRAJP|nr:unknown [Bradyrhizobium japonicum]